MTYHESFDHISLPFITAHITKHISQSSAVTVLLINRGPAWGYRRGSAPAAKPDANRLPGELINNRAERGGKTVVQLQPKFPSSAGWRAQPSCPEIKLTAARAASLQMLFGHRDTDDHRVLSLIAIIRMNLLCVTECPFSSSCS